jgi:PIN domain nuclease of toxin-antitoxin system
VDKGRLDEADLNRFVSELQEPAASFRLVPLDLGVAMTLRRVAHGAVPDMPDRIIAATALHLRLPLVSRDGEIRSSGIETIW